MSIENSFNSFINNQDQLTQVNEVEKPSLLYVARCYSLVFRGEPWNEAFLNEAGEFIGPEYDLTWRQKGLDLAYPLIPTSEYIRKETSRVNSVFITKALERRVIAFGWGYSLESPDVLIAEKWEGVENDDYQQILQVISNSLSNPDLWYLSEVGVLKKKRERGIATDIVTKLIKGAPENQDILMRTNANSPMTVIARNFGFVQILGPKTQRLDGKIVTSNAEVINCMDPMNPARVLYVLPAERRVR